MNKFGHQQGMAVKQVHVATMCEIGSWPQHLQCMVLGKLLSLTMTFKKIIKEYQPQ